MKKVSWRWLGKAPTFVILSWGMFSDRSPSAEGQDSMSQGRVRLIALCGVLVISTSFGLDEAFSQTQGARIRLQTAEDEVQADGSDVLTRHVEMQVLTPTFASQLAQFPISYDEALTDLNFVDAYTLKADGRKIAVDPSSIITQQPPGNNPLAAIFTNQK
jgi:hypothetical protein